MVRTPPSSDSQSRASGEIKPQAGLQRLLILELSQRTGPSVTALAERMGYGRPSVSRALSTLASRGLVARSGRSWSLTDNGRSEVDAIATGVSRSKEAAFHRERRIQAEVGRRSVLEAAEAVDMLGPAAAAINRFGQIHDAFGATLAAGAAIDRFAQIQDAFGAKLAAGSTLGRLVELDAGAKTFAAAAVIDRFGAVGEAVDASLTAGASISRLVELDAGAKMFAAAAGVDRFANVPDAALGGIRALAQELNHMGGLDSALGTQRLQAAFLDAGVLTGKWWSPAIGETMAITSRMAADLAAIDPLLMAPRSIVRALGKDISATAAAVARAHAQLTAAVLPSLDPLPPLDATAAVRSIMVPAASAGAYVRGGRRLLEPIGRSDEVNIPSHVRELAELMREVSPDAGEALLASWQRLHERGHDYHRGVAHHGREALRCILGALAPDEKLPKPSKGTVTRAARIRFVLAGASDHDAVWADAQIDATLRLFDVLNAEAHLPRIPAQGLAGILESLTGTIRFLMSYPKEGA